MNKRSAVELAKSETLTYQQLADMIDKYPKTGISKLNKSLTVERVCDILRKAIEQEDMSGIPKYWMYDPYKNKHRPSKQALIVVNILRQCA